jgi:hypothetical protein
MKSFDAHAVLAQVLGQLADPRLCGRIDATVDRASATFSYDPVTTWTSMDFDRVLILLVQHLHQHAMAPARRSLPYDAFADACRLLAGSYSTQSGRGYDAALVDALAEGAEAMRAVIDCVVDAFRERTKSLAYQWIIGSAIAPLNWEQRCQMAQALVEAGKDHLPEAILRSPPARLANSLADLIVAQVQVETYFAQFMSRAAPT